MLINEYRQSRYVTCIKCGRDHYGLNGDICVGCLPHSQRRKTPLCKFCNGKHLNLRGDDICSRCNCRENYRRTHCADKRRCTECNYVLRTTDERLTKCMRCMPRAEYFQIKYNRKKKETTSDDA